MSLLGGFGLALWAATLACLFLQMAKNDRLRDEKLELEAQLALERECARESERIDRENLAYLAGELSKAQNTLSLTVKDQEANAAQRKPVMKAKTPAEIRLAVQRMNSEEMVNDGNS